MNKYINLALGLTAIGIIAACSVSTDLDATIDREVEKAVEVKEKAKAPLPPITTDVVRVKDDIWLGDTSEIEYEGDPIPSYLETEDGITLVSSRPITLYEIGDMINKITSLSVRYDQELEQTVQQLADGNEPSLDAIGAQWTDSTKMLVSYKGPLTGLLDEISNRFGIWWKYEKKQIYFYKYVTKTFVLYSLPTKPSLSVNVGGKSSEGSSGSSSVSLSSSTSIDLWSNIESSIKSMITKGATLTTDQSNGTITLTGTPIDIRRVSKYVNEQNARLSRQVAISVKVLQVSISDSDQYGVDLSAAFQGGGSIDKLGVIGAASGTSTDSGLGMLTMMISSGDWSINNTISALSKQGTTNLVTSGSVTTLNNKPAPIQVVKTQKYVSEITISTSGSGENNDKDVSVETEEIETGFTMDVLPRILEHGRLMLMFNLTLSDLVNLEKVYTDENKRDSFVQNPIIETRGFTQEVALKSGETLILTGYERVEDVTDKKGLGSVDTTILGGGAEAKKTRSILVIMLTPVVMESPLVPESRMKQ